ncbi:hypothetical protein, partial [Lactiplantibacillus plantarum]|uniref:hypothetical protein n=1 Tax=Lactiplantibacillus plantarum TaxID=1590 RepID=UPI001FBC04E3
MRYASRYLALALIKTCQTDGFLFVSNARPIPTSGAGGQLLERKPTSIRARAQPAQSQIRVLF